MGEINRGCVQIYTGDGKGKTTAALGLALRAAGQGLNVIMIQFVKGNRECGEHLFISKYHPFELVQFADASSFSMPQDDLDFAVREALANAKKVLCSEEYHMVILDEIFVAVSRGLLSVPEVIDLVESKPESVELVMTGRKAPVEIVMLADMVTEMLMIKHPFTEGVDARRGIEY